MVNRANIPPDHHKPDFHIEYVKQNHKLARLPLWPLRSLRSVFDSFGYCFGIVSVVVGLIVVIEDISSVVIFPEHHKATTC